MCGITGYVAPGATPVPAEALQAMTRCISHRGPDSYGEWMDVAAGVGLGHRRLAIVDLSPEGAQPMHAVSGRYVIAFNGEVYNFRRLRDELVAAGHPVRGGSDTAVMLTAIDAWGLEVAVRRFVGIFAFALWDRREGLLHLVRDHMGVKPLYYAQVGGTLVFGSELKPLRGFPGFDATIDRDALVLLLRHNCIPAPYTVYRAARKLVPGSILTVRPGQPVGEAVPYWTAREAAERGTRDPLSGPDAVLLDRLHDQLHDAVGLQMMADVPLGAFLSGGIDSSLVVALMQAQADRPVRTFTLGSAVPGYDESSHAKAVAAHLGTEHTTLVVSPEDALATIPLMPRYYDEPFADSSQIPTYLVSKLARQHVTVALSGDGGDELFAGYTRHRVGERVWRRIRHLPMPLRHAMAGTLRLGARHDASMRRVLGRRVPWKYHVEKLAGLMGSTGPEQMYQRLTSQWTSPEAMVLGATEPPTILTDRTRWADVPTLTEQMMYLDSVTYLPDDILTKVDRASMAVSLEARVPLLDHRVVELAWRLPLSLKLRGGVSKWALRRVLERYVPTTLFERPKHGFGIPLDSWMRGPLRPWVEELLDERRLREDGFFAVEPIRRAWADHLSGRGELQYHLWTILMFQAWYHDGTGATPHASTA